VSFVDRNFPILVALVLLGWWLTRKRYGPRVAVLLAASLYFYGYGRWWWLGIMAGYCVVDWLTGLRLERGARPRLTLALGVGFNVAVLAFWKYTPLLAATSHELFGWPAAAAVAQMADRWSIPMGISFYAFTGIAYMVDVYRRQAPAERSFWRYALFTSFFPHLVAGPILRASEFLWHLQPAALMQGRSVGAEAAFLIARGFFKKMVLADSIAMAIDPFFAHVNDASTAGVWALPYIYLYALQILFDFSGYTDIARGLGLLFGFRWPENFNAPYLAGSIQDFWRRWHMTLSRFLRDYLYVPLGGNRHGPARSAAALMITMLLGGLWHGASWNFMLWGGLHGVYLVVHRLWAATPARAALARLPGVPGFAWRCAGVFLTFHAVCLAWCFFRLTTLPESLECLRRVVSFTAPLAGGANDPTLWLLLAFYGVAVLAARLYSAGAPLPEALRRFATGPLASGAVWGAAAGLLVVALALAPEGRNTPFIYFQF
jgi:alginate O-acetyltransferase complex protein AlgI